MGVLISFAAAAVAALALAQPALSAPAQARVAVTAASSAMPAAERRAKPRVLLRDVRACGSSLYNASRYQCARDERSHPLVSNTAYCTITIYAFTAATVHTSMSYGGQTLFAKTRRVRARTVFHLALSYELPVVLPAGRYACKFAAARKRASVSMTGAGDAGPVAYESVCSAGRTNASNLCSSDESALPLAPTSSLTCSGIFAGKKRHFAGVELLYNDNGTWTSLSKVEGQVSAPFVPGTLTVPSLLGQPFLPGQYMCRFTIDGQTSVEKPFSVRA